MRLALAGGGTGGHLFPGLAVAAEARAAGDEVVFFGSTGGIEARLVPEAGYELIAEPLSGVRGASPAAALRGLARAGRAAWRMRRELERRRIDVVVGLGGYASAPAVIGAAGRRPVVLLEQNCEPGLATRVLSRLAARVCTSFEQTASHLPPGRAVWTGNPVRREIETAADAGPGDRLLVLGGSGGARSLNRAVVRALAGLSERMALPAVLHQTGRRWLDETRAAYRDAGLEAHTEAFVGDMAAAYAGARLAVCRAGATTVAELVATATPAVLVPYPHAAAHQVANARALVAAEAAVIVADDERLADSLAQVLGGLLERPERIDSMAARLREMRRPGAAARVLEVVRAVALRDR